MKNTILKNLSNFRKMALLAFFILASGLFNSLSAQNIDWYFTNKNGWDMKKHVRTMGDVNGDGLDDIVGFGEKGVFVSFSKGINFTKPKLLINNFAIQAGQWSVSRDTRVVADVNGDGKADIVGFGVNGVLVSLSKGNSFAEPVLWLRHSYSPANGWNNKDCVRTAADVNGDGKADIVGFGGTGVYVAHSDGQKFLEPQLQVKNFAIAAGGWEVSKHTRLVTDINGDQKADIIGFGGNVYTDLSTGKAFGTIKEHKDLSFYTNPNWWNLKRHRRMMADVNGDGKSDIIGFTENKVYTSLSKGNDFETQKMCFEDFTYSKGWSPEQYPILMGDINGDGKDDIIGFKEDKVYVSCSHGSCFCPALAITFIE